MRKVKLVSCLSLIPIAAIGAATLSSCSSGSSYTIMNMSDITYVNAAQNEENENVTLCSDVYIYKPDHTTAVIDINNSKCTVDGPKKSLITQPHFVQNVANNSVNVLAKVSNWDGSTFVPGDLVLKLELKLEDGTPIDCKTSIILRHAYWIYPEFPVWNVTSPTSTYQLEVREGFTTETPISGVTWNIVDIPEEHKDDIVFDNQTSGLLKYKASAVPTTKYKIIVSATKDDYLVEKELWIA